jgi:hypothetical protein
MDKRANAEFKYLQFISDIANTGVRMCAAFLSMDQLLDLNERACQFLVETAERRYPAKT